LIGCASSDGRVRKRETARTSFASWRVTGACSRSRASAAVALELGFHPWRARSIRAASKLHDIGKIAIPDRILLKPGPLTLAEREIMQRHTVVGYELLADSGDGMLDLAASIALSHHERWDGTGYPQGLRGEEIPLEVRIAAIADVFDALRRPRA